MRVFKCAESKEPVIDPVDSVEPKDYSPLDQ